jgi:Mrp family chromosome partitioning ATPase
MAEEPPPPAVPIKPGEAGDPPARPFGRRSRTVRPRDEGKGLRIVATSLEDDPVATARLIDFARELTHDGRPIIVDLDARSTRLAALVAERSFSGLGLSDLAVGNASFGEVIHRDRASRLHFVSFGLAPGFAPADLDLILDALLQTYDFLVVAAPPLDKSPMASELAAHADMIALAAPARMDEAGLEAASEQFYQAGAAEVVVLDGQAVGERSDVLHVA